MVEKNITINGFRMKTRSECVWLEDKETNYCFDVYPKGKENGVINDCHSKELPSYMTHGISVTISNSLLILFEKIAFTILCLKKIWYTTFHYDVKLLWPENSIPINYVY